MKKIYKSGNLRGDKNQYSDGIGCSIWYPWNQTDFPEDEEEGVCFDFPASDIDDMIALLQTLKNEPAYPEETEMRDVASRIIKEIECTPAPQTHAEVARLREEIEAIGKAHHKDIVILGGLYLENKSLKAENARLREAARWIPVEERLPENNNAVLVTDGGHSVAEGSYVLGRWVAFSKGRYIHPTHWQPLPEPPEVE